MSLNSLNSDRVIGFEELNPQTNLTGRSHLEYGLLQKLFYAQPLSVRCLLEIQASLIVKAILNSTAGVDITLPNQVVWKSAASKQTKRLQIPVKLRSQSIKGKNHRLSFDDLIRFLDKSERSSESALSVYALLLRHAIGFYLTTNIMPSTLPNERVEKENYPQWLAFDYQNHLILDSIAEAQICIASLKQNLTIYEITSKVAPYFNREDHYRQKLNWLREQLINQGRALARYQTNQIIETIKKRASINSLNRGLNLSLPYFDDRTMEIKTYNFEVIPKGRIQFEPAYVWWVVREEQEKILMDKNLTQSTRNHLLLELKSLEEAFEDPEVSKFANRSFQQKKGLRNGIRTVRLAINAFTAKSFIKNR